MDRRANGQRHDLSHNAVTVRLCARVRRRIDVGPGRDLILGEVVHIHARDGLIDPRNKRIADERYRPIGRLYANRYCSTRQRFELPGPIPEE